MGNGVQRFRTGGLAAALRVLLAAAFVLMPVTRAAGLTPCPHPHADGHHQAGGPTEHHPGEAGTDAEPEPSGTTCSCGSACHGSAGIAGVAGGAMETALAVDSPQDWSIPQPPQVNRHILRLLPLANGPPTLRAH